MGEIIQKIADYLLEKNGILGLIAFVSSIIISPFIPKDWFQLLPFDEQQNTILVFAGVVILIYLVLKLICNIFSSIKGGISNISKNKQRAEKRKAINAENMEQLRLFFDEISDEEYSIIMYFIATQNKKPYKEWGEVCRCSYESRASIFSDHNKKIFFYHTTSWEEAPEEKCRMSDGSIKYMRVAGPAHIYSLKPEVYDELTEIIGIYGSLSHHDRKTVPLRFENKIGDDGNE